MPGDQLRGKVTLVYFWAYSCINFIRTRTCVHGLYRFHARDLNLADGRAVRFEVMIDGKAPGDSHGADTDAAGNGAVTQTRLYQLVRQAGKVGEHTFEIRFLDPDAHAYVFTFG